MTGQNTPPAGSRSGAPARAPAAIRTSRCASVSGWYSSRHADAHTARPRRLFSLARAAPRAPHRSAVRPAGGQMSASGCRRLSQRSAPRTIPPAPSRRPCAVLFFAARVFGSGDHFVPEFASPKSRDDVGRRSAAADDGTSLPLDAAAVLSGAPSPSVSAMTGTIHAWEKTARGRLRRRGPRARGGREKREEGARGARVAEAAHLGGKERPLGVVVRRLIAVVHQHALGVLARAARGLVDARGARARALVRVLVGEHVLDVRHLHEQRPRDHADHDERRDQHEEDVERREARRAADREQVAREDRDDLGRAEAGLERRDRRRRDHRREHARGAVQHPRRHAEQQHERDHEPPLEEQRRRPRRRTCRRSELAAEGYMRAGPYRMSERVVLRARPRGQRVGGARPRPPPPRERATRARARVRLACCCSSETGRPAK